MYKKIKIKRNKKKNIFSTYTIAILIFILLCAISIGYSLLTETLIINGTVTLERTQPVATENVEISYVNHYSSGNQYVYTFEFIISNNTGEDMYSWRVLIENLPHSASNFSNWNNEIESLDIQNGRAILTDKGWNGTINAGQSSNAISFRFSTTEQFDVTSLRASLLLPEPVTPEEPQEPGEQDDILKDIKIDFAVTSAWSQTVQYRITINNNSNTAISNCTFRLNLPEGTTHTIWSNATNNGNVFTCGATINPGGNTEVYGQYVIPDGYNASQYRKPQITVMSVD